MPIEEKDTYQQILFGEALTKLGNLTLLKLQKFFYFCTLFCVK